MRVLNPKQIVLSACLAAAGSGLAVSAQAQTRAPSDNAVETAGFYVGAGIGRAKANDACDFGAIGFVGSCDDKSTTWNLFAGYQFTPNIAVEAGYVDLGKVSASGRVGGTPVSASAETQAFELVGVGMLPVAPSISLYGKLGLARWDADATASSAVVVTASDKGTDFTAGLGAQYAFNRNFAARAEWQYYNDVADSNIHVLRVGVRYKF